MVIVIVIVEIVIVIVEIVVMGPLKTTLPQRRDTPPLEDSQNATETTDLSESTALPHHAPEPTDQRMDQPVPHAFKVSQMISHITTPTPPPEDHTPPPVIEPEPKPVSDIPQTHQIMLTSTTQT